MTEGTWRLERIVNTVDTDGSPTIVKVGLVEHGKHLSPALRIDDGRTVLLPLQEGADVITNIRQTLETFIRGHAG